MNIQHIELSVTGMTCNHCQTAVTKALSAVQGVTTVHVNLEHAKASIDGTQLDAHALIAAITAEGYAAQQVQA